MRNLKWKILLILSDLEILCHKFKLDKAADKLQDIRLKRAEEFSKAWEA